MVQRRAAVVEDPHGKDAVEKGQVFRDLLDADGNNVVLGVVQVALQHEKLQDRGEEGLDAQDELGALAAHAPAVVAVTAADVEDAPPGKGLDVRQHPVPLPVRAPFGVDVHAEDVVGALAPGVKGLEPSDEPVVVDRAQIRGRADGDGVLQLDPRRDKLGERMVGLKEIGKLRGAVLLQPLGHECPQFFGPALLP